MTDLSAAAQAIIDALASQMEGGWISPEFIPYESRKIAATIEALADQVVQPDPCGNDCCISTCEDIRDQILAIAAELRGTDS